MVQGVSPWTISSHAYCEFANSTKGVDETTLISLARTMDRVRYWSLVGARGNQTPVPHGGRPHPCLASIVEREQPYRSSERNALCPVITAPPCPGWKWTSRVARCHLKQVWSPSKPTARLSSVTATLLCSRQSSGNGSRTHRLDSFRLPSNTKSECTPPARSPEDSLSAKGERPRRQP